MAWGGGGGGGGVVLWFRLSPLPTDLELCCPVGREAKVCGGSGGVGGWVVGGSIRALDIIFN